MDILRKKVADLVQDPRNARMHNRRNLDQIKKSLKRFGQQKPIVVTHDGIVRAGNGTLTAAAELGWDEIDIVYSELGEQDAIAYGIADNRSNELSEWDSERLAELIGELDDAELRDVIGFDTTEIDELLKGVVVPDEPINVADQVVKNAWYVMITCRDDADQRRMLEKMTKEGYECRALTS